MITNRISLLGNAVRKAQVKTFENGSRIAQFSLATNERGFTTKSGVVVPDRTDFHNLVVRGGLVSVVEKYIDKGSKLSVVGVLRYRTYEKDGQKHTVAEIHVREIELLGGKRVKVQTEQNEPIGEEQHVVFKATEEDDLPF